jgi:glycosyltransferase involved in cell wall biosynthesis
VVAGAVSRGAARFSGTLGVVTHVPHWPGGAQPLAYEPYVREMEIWATLFERVEILAPRAEGPLRGNQAAYEAENIRWRPVTYSNSYGLAGQLKRVAQVPGLLRELRRFLRTTDIVLLRAPGHPALFARLLADRMGLPHITKWAGFFGPYPGARLPVRLERRLATRARWPVMVYGPSSLPHLVTFPPALMSREELARGAELASSRAWTPPWRLFSAGRLLGVKGFDLALRGLARLRTVAPDLPWHYTLVGDGPSAAELRELASGLGIADRVTFPGALPFETVRACYAESHVVIMPGVKEGWPKAIAEAWAHGAVPVAAAAGLVPWILDGGRGGVTFPPTPEGLAEELHRLLSQPGLLRQLSAAGPSLAAELSLEAFRGRLEEVLVSHCGLPGA